jgi:hypothetical protein
VTAALHAQNVIALIWDFDKTLAPEYMQRPLFDEYQVDPNVFWNEVAMLPAALKKMGVNVHPDTSYLNHLLTYVKAGKMPGLNNAKLRELGGRIRFNEGVPAIFELLRRDLPDDVVLEHYIVSTGLRAMVEGSAVSGHVEDIWASEFIEAAPQPGYDLSTVLPAGGEISQIAIAYDNTSKTRALFEINKGSSHDPAIKVNARMSPEDRRVPFEQMIYIADGPSDVPAFSVVKNNGGNVLAVCDLANDKSFEQANALMRDGRIDYFGPADFRDASITTKWLRSTVRRLAEGVVARRQTAVKSRVGGVPEHLADESSRRKH